MTGEGSRKRKTMCPPTNAIEEMRHYFALRARRYANALRGCPAARALDYVPYIAAMAHIKDIGALDVLDAFGGTGFLSEGLNFDPGRVVIADCTPEMMEGVTHALGVRREAIADDFDNMANRYEGAFDVVLSHGGLHHAIALTDEGLVDAEESMRKQCRVIENLCRCLRPGGLMVLGDIPAPGSRNRRGEGLSLNCLDRVDSHIAAEPVRTELQGIAQRFLHGNLSVVNIDAAFRASDPRPDIPVPAYFFDNFVAKRTHLGHKANYPDFDVLIAVAERNGMIMEWGIDYRGPWLFSDRNTAGWYFREKFSIGTEGARGAHAEENTQMMKELREYLGVQEIAERCLVNWGVYYSCLRRTE